MLELSRRKFLFGIGAALAVIRTPGLLMPVKAFEAELAMPQFVHVPHRAFVVLNDGLLYWNGENDPLSWNPVNHEVSESWRVGEPLDKSLETGVATLSNV